MTDRRRLALAALLFLFAALIGLAAWAGIAAIADVPLLIALTMRESSAIAHIAYAVTTAGDFVPRCLLALVVVGWLAWRGQAVRAALYVLTVASGALLIVAIKALVMRPRPDLLPHLDVVGSTSFPSAHAANNMIVWLGIALLAVPAAHRALAVAVALVVAMAIGVSRVALAVHWPSDVAAGWCIGAGWVLFCQALAKSWLRRSRVTSEPR